MVQVNGQGACSSLSRARFLEDGMVCWLRVGDREGNKRLCFDSGDPRLFDLSNSILNVGQAMLTIDLRPGRPESSMRMLTKAGPDPLAFALDVPTITFIYVSDGRQQRVVS